jgi:hypothetical protein
MCEILQPPIASTIEKISNLMAALIDMPYSPKPGGQKDDFPEILLPLL